jgi:hypothetical protein
MFVSSDERPLFILSLQVLICATDTPPDGRLRQHLQQLHRLLHCLLATELGEQRQVIWCSVLLYNIVLYLRILPDTCSARASLLADINKDKWDIHSKVKQFLFHPHRTTVDCMYWTPCCSTSIRARTQTHTHTHTHKYSSVYSQDPIVAAM